ncbi:MAG: hypothetical protein GX153_11185 [Clostridiaceae bacterium]|nr:hypothetical protein [Clostridiaceae bacterium]
MFTSSLARLAARKGWKREESYLYRGDWNGCPVSLIDGEGFVEVVISFPGLDTEAPAWEALSKLIDGYSGLKIVRRTVTDGFLSVRIRRRLLSVSADSLDLFLNILIEEAKDRGLAEQNLCAVCHKPADEVGTLFDLACYIHEDCRRQAGDDLPAYPPYLMYEHTGKDPFRFLKAKK